MTIFTMRHGGQVVLFAPVDGEVVAEVAGVRLCTRDDLDSAIRAARAALNAVELAYPPPAAGGVKGRAARRSRVLRNRSAAKSAGRPGNG